MRLLGIVLCSLVCVMACALLSCGPGAEEPPGDGRPLLRVVGSGVTVGQREVLVLVATYGDETGLIVLSERVDGPSPAVEGDMTERSFAVEGSAVPGRSVVFYDHERHTIEILAERWDIGLADNMDALEEFIGDLLDEKGVLAD